MEGAKLPWLPLRRQGGGTANVIASTLPWEQREEEWEWVVGEWPVLKEAGSCKVEGKKSL